MKLGFFEEYATAQNLDKLRLVNFPISLHLGIRDIKQFLTVKHEIEKKFKQVKEIVYWPLLKVTEGYWFSGFTKTTTIERVITELNSVKENFPVLWDAELPLFHKQLFLTELPHLRKNSFLIHSALLHQNPKHPLIVAQFPRSNLKELFARICATAFSFTHYHRLDMLYTSMMKRVDKERYIRQIMRLNKDRYQKYSVGLGLIDKGEGDPTPLFTLAELERDLRIASQEKIAEVVIYRLGGVNKEYLQILKRHAS